MTTATQTLSPDEIADQGKALYERHLRDRVLNTHFGQYLVIDIATGEYEIGADHLETARRARAKHPDAALYGLKIGYPGTDAIGTRLRPLQESKRA